MAPHVTIHVSRPRTARLILHGRIRQTASVHINAENKHVLRLSRRRDHSIVRSLRDPCLAPTIREASAQRGREAKAARKAERQHLREQERKEEAELAKQRRSTAGLPQENTPLRSKTLSSELLEEIVGRLHPGLP